MPLVRPAWRSIAEWLLLAATCVALLLPLLSLGAPFYWDDAEIISSNPYLRLPWYQAVAKPLFHGDTGGFNYYRPLPQLVFSMTGRVFGFDQPVAFHAVQLFFIGLTFVAVYRLVRRFAPPREAYFATVLFAVFPVNIEAYVWSAALPDVLAFLFGVLFLAGWLHDRETGHLPARSLLWLTAALFCKEGAVWLLPMTLFIDARELLAGRRWRFQWPLWVVLGGYVAVHRLVVPFLPAVAPRPWLTAKAFWAYVAKLAYPWPLGLLGGEQTVNFDGFALLGCLALSACVAVMLLAKELRLRVASAMLVAAFIPYSHVWKIPGENILIAERYMLPMVLALVLLVTYLWRGSSRLAAAMVMAAVLGYAPSTVARYQAWHDPQTFWWDLHSNEPGKVLPLLELARLANRDKQWAKAQAYVTLGLANTERRMADGRQITYAPAVLANLHYESAFAKFHAGDFQGALADSRQSWGFERRADSLIVGVLAHDRLFHYAAAASAAVRGTALFPRSHAVVELAAKLAVFGGDAGYLATLGNLRDAPDVERELAAAKHEQASIAPLAPYPRAVAYTRYGLASLSFPWFAAAATSLTRQQALEVSALAEALGLTRERDYYGGLANPK